MKQKIRFLQSLKINMLIQLKHIKTNFHKEKLQWKKLLKAITNQDLKAYFGMPFIYKNKLYDKIILRLLDIYIERLRCYL